MIETESTSPHRNPVPWLTPMVVMWSTVIIVIALIVLGTWLNKRKAAFDTHEAREKLDAIVAAASFTEQQKQTLIDESDTMLASAGVGIARREAATRWFHRMEQSLACVTIRERVDQLDALLRKRPAGPATDELLKRWDLARRESDRTIYVVDRHDVNAEDSLKELDEAIKAHAQLTAAQIDALAADFRDRADKQKAPDPAPPFDLYDSLYRGITESKEEQTPASEKDKAAQR